MRLIPAIDLKDGRCVRLLRGDFAAETRYATDPGTLVDRYLRMGADWLHVVDLDGARDGEGRNRDIIAELTRRRSIKLQVGGGLRTASDVSGMLNDGVGRVVIGSAAVTQVELVRGWLAEFGAERVVLAFDVRMDAAGIPCVAIHGWREQSALPLWDALAAFVHQGLRHVLCTDVSRDGALSGPNVPLYAEAARRFPGIEWQASGGIRNAADLAALEAAGARAAISGKALLDDLIPHEELRAFLPNASSPA